MSYQLLQQLMFQGNVAKWQNFAKEACRKRRKRIARETNGPIRQLVPSDSPSHSEQATIRPKLFNDQLHNLLLKEKDYQVLIIGVNCWYLSLNEIFTDSL